VPIEGRRPSSMRCSVNRNDLYRDPASAPQIR
jgi:hypothetical protein